MYVEQTCHYWKKIAVTLLQNDYKITKPFFNVDPQRLVNVMFTWAKKVKVTEI